MIDERPHVRPRSLTAQRGFDKMRYMRDHLVEMQLKGARVDLVLVSPATMHELQTAWLEMAPENAPMPQDIHGVNVRQDTAGVIGTLDYAFLRDYLPWEKRAMLNDGKVDGYREGAKAPVATGERR